MRRTLTVVVTAGFIAACSDESRVVGPSDLAPLFSMGGAVQAERFIVVFRAAVLDPDVLTDQLVRGHGGAEHYRYRYALKGFAATLPAPAVEAIRRNPNVAWVEADGVVTIVVTQTNATWGLDRIDQRALPLSTTYTYDHSGASVHAYVIDTGIRSTHNEFTGRIGNGFTAISSGGTEDCHGHGTHVAGTVGGTVYGVAKAVTLHPVRVLNCNGSGTTSGVIAGVDWVTGNAIHPAVANMSLGGGANTSLDNAVVNSINSGVTYAVAAGNSNANACNTSPARAGPALTVGSTTMTDARSSFSNFGTCLDIFAPGSSITSAWNTSNTATNTISGTSMASPHVAGVAALYLSISGNGNATPATVSQAIIDNGTTGVVGNAGSGSPNRLLHSLFSGGGTNSPPTASFTFSCTNLSCSFDGSASADPDGAIVNYAWAFGDGTTGSGQTVNKTYGAAGTYTVTLTVTDDDGATGAQSRSVTVTSGSGGGIVVHVAGLNGSSTGSGPNWTASVTATVRDASSNLVGGATVTAGWSTGGTGSCTTGSAGTCMIQSPNLRRNVSSTTLTVTGISGTNMTYDASQNTVTSITVGKP